MIAARSFRPSRLSYGAPIEEAAGEAGADTPIDKLVEEYAPAVRTVAEQIADASRQVEVLDAQIANTRRLISLSPFGGELLRMRLRKLEARKRAALRRLEKQQEGESATRTWRVLGQVGLVVGIGLGVALTVRVLR